MRGGSDGQGQLHRGADRCRPAPRRGRDAGGGGLPQAGGQRADVLSLEEEVRRDGCRRTTQVAATRGREQAAQAAGGRPDAGQAAVAGGDHKKTVKPAQRRELVAFLRVGFTISERRACRVIPIPRSSQRYQSQAKDQSALKLRLRDLAHSRLRSGYRRLHVLLQREGWRVNHKRVYRLYRLEGLSLRLKSPKKRVSGLRGPKPIATRPDECWSMDFMADRLVDGQRFRVLTFVDNVSRVSPAIVADHRLTGERVVEVLEGLLAAGQQPEMLSIDNGPEFISRALDA